MSGGRARGRIVRIAEPDYRYGVGVLVLRVDYIDTEEPVVFDGELWYQVHGVQLGAGDVERGPREVLVRGRRLADLR